MRTNAQMRWDLRRALAKRGPSGEGWRWEQKPTALELSAWYRMEKARMQQE